jgi:hypothetical protein
MPQVDFTLEDIRKMMAKKLDKAVDRLDARIDRLEVKMDRRFDVVEFRLRQAEGQIDDLKFDLGDRSRAIQQDYVDVDRRVVKLEKR